MKIKINPLVKKAATTLLVTLCLITLIAVSIAGYLSYVEQQTLLGARSQAWNQAIAVSEAGVEEALQLLNTDITTYAANGWSLSGAIYTSPTRQLGNGNSYLVRIDATSSNSPVIVSRAFVTPPTFVKNKTPFFLAAVGVNQNGDGTINRAVRVRAGRSKLFLASLVAKHTIDMNGNNVRTDSYDSGDPAKSTNGKYDINKAGGNGDVASNDGVLNAVSVGNANIFGHVMTGPKGTVTVGPQGYVGPMPKNGTGIQTGYVSDTANFTFPETDLPYNSGTSPTGGNVVSIVGFSTNVTSFVGVSVPPGAPPAGYSMGPVTTNTALTTTSVYPGAVPGLRTNISYITVDAYPGLKPGLTTNYTHYVNSNTYPGAQPGLTTNFNLKTTSTLPIVGTYFGSITTNFNGNSGNEKSYTYNLITGYTYADQFSYTYQVNTYTYPNYTYTYSLYAGLPVYATNYYDHILEGGHDYYATSLTGTSIVTGPNVRLVMPNGIAFSGGNTITIASDPLHIGAGVTVYSGGDSLSLAGNAVINDGGFAGSFIVYAAPTVTSISFSGNAAFTGVVVAPNANLVLNGAGNDTYDISGALLVNSATLNGHFNFHYDEALSRMPATGRFIITQWDEIP